VGEEVRQPARFGDTSQAVIDGQDAEVDTVVTMPRARLNQLLGEVDAATLLAEGDVTLEGDAAGFRTMLEMLDDFGPWFDIVTP